VIRSRSHENESRDGFDDVTSEGYNVGILDGSSDGLDDGIKDGVVLGEEVGALVVGTVSFFHTSKS